MKVTIKKQKASALFFNGTFLDTGKELELPFSDVFRLARETEVHTTWEPSTYDLDLFRTDKFFNFFGDVDPYSGFGGVSYNLVKYSRQYKIALAGRAFGDLGAFIYAAQNRPLNQNGAMVWHDQPRESWSNTPFKRNIAIVPFETTRVPKSWISRLNDFNALLVPCKQNIEMFRDSGVTIPIDLIHWGVDPEIFHEVEHKTVDGCFTFGHMGALSIRKGTDLLIEAFQEAFPTEKDVKLLCKTSYNGYPFMVKDKRIEVQMGQVTHAELLKDFFSRVNCFVFPTRGEGFGLTNLEAMATGTPVITTGWSGPLEYMKPEYGWLIDYKMEYAKNFADTVYKEDCGDWALPNKEHLKQLMRYAYEHQDEVKEKGHAAAEYVQREWLWDAKIKMYHEALEKHL